MLRWGECRDIHPLQAGSRKGPARVCTFDRPQIMDPRTFLKGVREGDAGIVRKALAQGLSPNTLYIQRRGRPVAHAPPGAGDASHRHLAGGGRDRAWAKPSSALHVTPALVLAVEHWDCNGPDATFRVVQALLEAGGNTRAMSSVGAWGGGMGLHWGACLQNASDGESALSHQHLRPPNPPTPTLPDHSSPDSRFICCVVERVQSVRASELIGAPGTLKLLSLFLGRSHTTLHRWGHRPPPPLPPSPGRHQRSGPGAVHHACRSPPGGSAHGLRCRGGVWRHRAARKRAEPARDAPPTAHEPTPVGCPAGIPRAAGRTQCVAGSRSHAAASHTLACPDGPVADCCVRNAHVCGCRRQHARAGPA
jgi:hypothetical protein